MSTKLKYHNLDTTGWIEFPFSANGVNFISKISPKSPMLSRILNLSEGMFDSMNQGAVYSLIGHTNSIDDIAMRLIELNEGASHAVIEVA